MSKRFVNYLESIPEEKINHWKRKNGIDLYAPRFQTFPGPIEVRIIRFSTGYVYR